jgi:hypothetical protein
MFGSWSPISQPAGSVIVNGWSNDVEVYAVGPDGDGDGDGATDADVAAGADGAVEGVVVGVGVGWT